MQVKDIEIHTGTIDFPFKALRRLEAKVEATMAFSPAPTIDEANAKLRELATKVGANAVIEVEYNSGVSMTSWKSMKATGLAVIRESDEIECESCAEKIKRSAKKCRFCGLERETEQPVAQPVQLQSASAHLSAEPLRGTNNPQIWLIVGAAIFLILTIIGMASS